MGFRESNFLRGRSSGVSAIAFCLLQLRRADSSEGRFRDFDIDIGKGILNQDVRRLRNQGSEKRSIGRGSESSGACPDFRGNSRTKPLPVKATLRLPVPTRSYPFSTRLLKNSLKLESAKVLGDRHEMARDGRPHTDVPIEVRISQEAESISGC